MKVRPLNTKIEGPLVIENAPFFDQRGFFAELFNVDKFKEAGLQIKFAQDNHSRSEVGVLRGLHIQTEPLQGKLVWVVSGKIFDVIIDCRPTSPTFLQSTNVTLDSEKPGEMIWVPEGFAHGFCVLGNTPAHVLYKMTSPYNPKGETGLLWNDPGLKINWPIKNPVVSERDQKLLTTKEFREKFKK